MSFFICHFKNKKNWPDLCLRGGPTVQAFRNFDLSLSASKISNLEGKLREIKKYLERPHSKEGVGIPLYIKFSKKLPLVFQRKSTIMC
jgi:hypothetical protein